MITRFNLLTAAALGLALASGALTNASAKTVATERAPVTHAATVHKTHGVHAVRAHRVHAIHHAARTTKHLAAGKLRGSARHAGRVTKRQHQAMAHRVGGKTIVTR